MDYIQVGKIINTHGIKGEVRILPFTDDKKRFEDLEKLYIGENKLEVDIKSVRYKDNLVMLKFENYDDINDVEKFKNAAIYIDEKDRIELKEDQFFIFDIIGCLVVDTSNRDIGTVVDVIKLGSGDIYVVKDNGKEYMVPAVKEFIKDVDIKKKLIKIDPIEGLI